MNFGVFNFLVIIFETVLQDFIETSVTESMQDISLKLHKPVQSQYYQIGHRVHLWYCNSCPVYDELLFDWLFQDVSSAPKYCNRPKVFSDNWLTWAAYVA